MDAKEKARKLHEEYKRLRDYRGFYNRRIEQLSLFGETEFDFDSKYDPGCKWQIDMFREFLKNNEIRVKEKTFYDEYGEHVDMFYLAEKKVRRECIRINAKKLVHDVNRLWKESKKRTFFLKCISDLSRSGEAVFGSRAYKRDWLNKEIDKVVRFMDFHGVEVDLEWDEPCRFTVHDKEVKKELRNIYDEEKQKMEDERAKRLEELSKIIDEIQ